MPICAKGLLSWDFMIDRYISYISSVRRYSKRSCELYRTVLEEFMSFVEYDGEEDVVQFLTVQTIRSYEVHLMDDRRLNARTVNQHLSIISGFCRFLMKSDLMSFNPVRLVTRPRQESRLPDFCKPSALEEYFRETASVVEFGSYDARLRHLIISLLAHTGIRRAELISLDLKSVDFVRRKMRVRGKGDKIREIPLLPSLCEEISLYLRSVDSLKCAATGPDAPLLQTPSGKRLYPVFVDRAVKRELGMVSGISGRRSPHVLRHTLATELLNEGTELNSIKELLGHANLAATQVYTHNSIERLKAVYNNAHPRAKNGGKNGD